MTYILREITANSLLITTDRMVISSWMHKTNSWNRSLSLSLFAFQSRSEASLPVISSDCASVHPANGHGTYQVDFYQVKLIIQSRRVSDEPQTPIDTQFTGVGKS